jgi:hypothetical protein
LSPIFGHLLADFMARIAKNQKSFFRTRIGISDL